MSDNAYERILPARYLCDGEDPEDLFPRVAANVALAEIAHADEDIYVRPADVKPDHPSRTELVAEICDGVSESELSENPDGTFDLRGENWNPKIELTPENVSKFSWNSVTGRIIDEQQESDSVIQDTDRWRRRFQEMMSDLKFIPNSPTLMNAGDELQQLSACFVDSPADDITDIHQTAKEAAEVFQSGGGMGYAFWQLRPYGDQVGSTDGIASGPITFMRTYDQMCETIAQGGARRGAQMGIMRVSHPDVIQFIHAKNKDVSLANSLRLNDPDDFTHNSFNEALDEAREILDRYDGAPEMFRNAVEGHLSNFNISVGITNDFMEAVKNDELYTFTNPQKGGPGEGEPHIATEETKQLYERFDLGEYVEVGEPLEIPAREIWDDIIDGAHENGEPGVVYLERINEEHSFDVEENPDHRILATNPCLAGDMEVAVADGREQVPIKKLALENGKTPVYTEDEDGDLDIIEASAFRTKKGADLVEIETDGDATLKVTPDHKVYTNNRGQVEAQDLKEGDSLQILSRWTAGMDKVLFGGEGGTPYRWVRTSNGNMSSEHRNVVNYLKQEEIDDNEIVHHIDHDSLNNRPENLEVMDRGEHTKLHHDGISGEDNPVHILKERGEFEEFMERNSFYDVEGENNPMWGADRSKREERECVRIGCERTFEAIPSSDQECCSHFCARKSDFGREWAEFRCGNCGEHQMVQTAQDRKYCSRACAAEDTLEGEARRAFLRHLEEDNPMKDPEVAARSAASQDYKKTGKKISETRKEKIESGEMEVEIRNEGDVVCEECGEEFKSITNTHLQSEHDMTTDEYREKYGDLGCTRPVMTQNHKVVSVNEAGSADVYDLNVPGTHNFFAAKNPEENPETSKESFFRVRNCGEQPLEEYEACNLGHINLSTIVDEDTTNRDWREFNPGKGFEANSEQSQSHIVGEFLDQAIDWQKLDDRIRVGTRFLENVVTMSDFPVPEIEQKVREMRKIGLGIMGYAQLLPQLGIQYGTPEGNEVARQLMTHINHTSKGVSSQISDERGVFDEWENSKYADPTEYREWFEKQTGEDADDWEDGFPLRNHNTTTIAPTGTTSMVGNTSGGCEPIYDVIYRKNVSQDVQGEEMLAEADDYFLRVLEANGIDSEAVLEEADRQIRNNEFDGINGLDRVPNQLKELFVTSGDLTAKQHASVQCAFQEGVDSAISKTCNFPHETTKADMKEVYEYIWDNGGKGVTVYRDGTRSKQVLTTRQDNKQFSQLKDDFLLDEIEARTADNEFTEELFERVADNDDQTEAEDLVAEIWDIDVAAGDEDLPWYENGHYAKKRARPDVLHGTTQRVDTGYGKLYVNINVDDEGRPFELFVNTGNSGGFTNGFVEAVAKTASTALRSGVNPQEIANELQGIQSPKVGYDQQEQINSIPDAIGTALERFMEKDVEKIAGVDATTAPEPEEEIKVEDDGGIVQELVQNGEMPECPECGAMSLYYSEGCKTCESCGWSEC